MEMDLKTVIALARLGCGTALLITSLITGYNGNIHSIALVLLGIPFEAIQNAKTTEEKD